MEWALTPSVFCPFLFLGLQGTILARLELLALAGTLAELANHLAQESGCTQGRPAQPTTPLDLVACSLANQNASRLHVRVLWGAEGQVGVGQWGDYFQPLRVLSESGHVKLDVQRRTEEFVAPKGFVPFKVLPRLLAPQPSSVLQHHEKCVIHSWPFSLDAS